MRSVLPLLAACLALAPLALGFAGDAARQETAPLPTSLSDNDAAAKHARRTACLKEAKERKLVGAQKAAFLKECMAAP
jgi:hypothetical protein